MAGISIIYCSDPHTYKTCHSATNHSCSLALDSIFIIKARHKAHTERAIIQPNHKICAFNAPQPSVVIAKELNFDKRGKKQYLKKTFELA